MGLLWFYWGCCWGSFLTVVATRTCAGEPFWRGRSYCQTCGQQLHWWELLPLVSFIWQRGRCRACHVRLPVHLLGWELTAGSCVLLSPPISWANVSWLAFLLGLQLLSTCDATCRCFPGWTMIPLVSLGLLVTVHSQLVCLLLSGGYLCSLSLNRHEHWLGNGDLDVLWLLLLVFPLATWCLIVLGAALGGLGLLAWRRQRTLPFLPPLFVSTLLVLARASCFPP
ncbi:prepilin peptidase [Fructilactobacillus myrtifloralis]|uniref:Prepilin peptidase n=1 Tax=Fructilactobacillus myrtifloralis TaxID=2940301 RepID=A0ABY5BR35_9LACO|nr:prepilin peptidase [Fructilactobacillus myrtifloralis]USS85651.1 prepilin peptidase [Fructilactobacillus myrtifloralis]